MTRKKRSKLFLITSILLISVGLIYATVNFAINYKINDDNKNGVSRYLKETSVKNGTLKMSTINNKVITADSPNQYIAVLEIPKINLLRGLVNPNSKSNNVNNNIQILNNFTPPSVNNSNLILASHSGNSNISFFKHIYKLKYGDEIIIYYNGQKYFYKVANVSKVAKDGTLKENRNNSKTTLTLTTCDKDNSKQLVIVAYQFKVGDY